MKQVTLFLVILLLIVYPVSAVHCLEEIQSEKTSDFLSETESLDSKLGTCDNTVPSPADKFFKNEAIEIKLLMRDSSTQLFHLETQGAKIISIEEGAAAKPTLIVAMGECEFDTLLRSNNMVGFAAYLYMQDKVTVTAVGFFKKIFLGIAKIFAKSVFKRIQAAEEISCTVNSRLLE